MLTKEYLFHQNLPGKILLLTIGNFHEGSIDHIVMDNLTKTQSYYYSKSNYSLKVARKSTTVHYLQKQMLY